MTFQKAFEAIKQKFDGASVDGISDFALQVTLSDEDCGGTFYIAVQNGVLDIAPYDYRDNTAVLDITKADFTSLAAGKKSLQKVVDNGATLKGNEYAAEAIKKIAATVKKAPAKKTVAKKTVKKETAKKTTAAVKKPAAKATKAAAVKTTAAPKEETKKVAPAAKKAPAADTKKVAAVKKPATKTTTK